MIEFVEASAAHVPLVVSTWRDSYRDSYTAGLIGNGDWSRIMVDQIRRILARPGVELWVAVNPAANPELKADCHGWIATERGFQLPTRRRVAGQWRRVLATASDPLVHYVYVKSAYRRRGIARRLFEAAGVDPELPFFHSCATETSSRLRKKAPRARFNPIIARYPKHEVHTHESHPRQVDPVPVEHARGAGYQELQRELGGRPEASAEPSSH